MKYFSNTNQKLNIMNNNYEIERLTALLSAMGVPNVNDVVADATPDDLRSIGKRFAFVNDSVSKPTKLGSQKAFDVYEYESLVKLLFDVQLGNVSCRRAATEINNQMPLADLINENDRLKTTLEQIRKLTSHE